jgi:peroxiredoxin
MAKGKQVLVLLFAILFVSLGQAQTTIGDFSLKDITGQQVSLKDYLNRKAVVVIFTSSHCSYAKKYEGRLAEMYQAYAPKGIQFIAINSNDPTMSESDSPEVMRQLRPFPFPYLKDDDQNVARQFNATKTPEVFILKPQGGQFAVVYQGKIDDNPLDSQMVKQNFLQEALDQMLSSQPIAPDNTVASGCNIKWK